MALSSAGTAGIEIPNRPLELAAKWLDSTGAGEHGGIYGNDRSDDKTPNKVASGFFTRHLLREAPDTARMRESLKHLTGNLPNSQDPNFHYWFFGTLALFQSQGEEWQAWNQQLRNALLKLQEKEGKDAGSWPPSGTHHMNGMGRVITTAYSTLSLQAYYRHLQIFQLSRDREEYPPGQEQ